MISPPPHQTHMGQLSSEYNPWKIFLEYIPWENIPCTMCKCVQPNSLMTEILQALLSVGVCEHEGNKPINQIVEHTVVST